MSTKAKKLLGSAALLFLPTLFDALVGVIKKRLEVDLLPAPRSSDPGTPGSETTEQGDSESRFFARVIDDLTWLDPEELEFISIRVGELRKKLAEQVVFERKTA